MLFSICLESGRKLNVSHFHNHWRLVKVDTYNPINRATSAVEPTWINIQEAVNAADAHQQINFIVQMDRIVNNGSSTFLRDPQIAVTKGRPPKNNSTKRNPSHFEYVEGTGRKCGICGKIGHDRRTCEDGKC